MHTHVFPILRSVLVSILLSILLLFFASILLYTCRFSNGVVHGITLAVYAITNFVGGFLVGKRIPIRRFLWGLLCGILYSSLLLLISFAAFGVEQFSMAQFFTASAVSILCAMLGAVIS